ncbi:hypothetical protein ECPA9_1356, partial [Escherichia coli PA9]
MGKGGGRAHTPV